MRKGRGSRRGEESGTGSGERQENEEAPVGVEVVDFCGYDGCKVVIITILKNIILHFITCNSPTFCSSSSLRSFSVFSSSVLVFSSSSSFFFISSSARAMFNKGLTLTYNLHHNQFFKPSHLRMLRWMTDRPILVRE